MNGNGNQRDWIEELCIQRKTLYSNSLLIESEDTKRINELLDERPPIAVAKKYSKNQRWLILDGWEGFAEYKKIKNDLTGKMEWGKEPFKKGNVQQYGIRQVLPQVSKELYEKEKNILIITNIFKTEDLLNNAIRGWATSEKLRETDTTVIVFVDDRSIFPPEVWSHMKIVKPPKSTWTGKINMIIERLESKENFSFTLSSTNENDTINITFGDQTFKRIYTGQNIVVSRVKESKENIDEISDRFLSDIPILLFLFLIVAVPLILLFSIIMRY